ncbi:type II toxin-antitoxin system RelE/ParE family toxin [Pseudomonas prosekii]|nr:type II toxin-antitoxin system RelE/ParE family toxin [Pseudomonas prosekii]
MPNITPRQLVDLRELAKAYGGLTEMEIQRLLDMQEFVEISHE